MGEHQNSRRIKLDRGAEKKGTADERRGEERGSCFDLIKTGQLQVPLIDCQRVLNLGNSASSVQIHFSISVFSELIRSFLKGAGYL